MLEMLQDLIDIIVVHIPIQSDKKYMAELEKVQDAVQLIKQATEI